MEKKQDWEICWWGRRASSLGGELSTSETPIQALETGLDPNISDLITSVKSDKYRQRLLVSF